MENRIELERRGMEKKKITELNLDNTRSTSIVGLTDEYSNLECLSLINVGLTTLKGLPDLTKLKKLELSDNRISSGLDFLLKLPGLTNLSLSGNRIKDFESLEPLAKLDNLKSLDLFNCEVTSEKDYRPKVFEMIPQLKFLDGADRDDKEMEESESEVEDDDEDDGLEDGLEDEEEEEDEGATEEDDEEEEEDDDEVKEVTSGLNVNVNGVKETIDIADIDEDDDDDDDDDDDEDEEEEEEDDEAPAPIAGISAAGAGDDDDDDDEDDEEEESDEDEELGLDYLNKENLSDEDEDEEDFNPDEVDEDDFSEEEEDEEGGEARGVKRKHDGEDDES